MSTSLERAEQQGADGEELHGFYYNMPFEEYAAIPAMNGSKIVHMRRSPMKYKHEVDNPTPPSAAMQMGSLVHRMILEPDLVGEIAVWGLLAEEKVRRGKVWDDFQKANEGRTILTVNEYMDAKGQANSALQNVPIRRYATSDGPTEVSMFWRHPYTNRRYKARIDKLILDTHTIFDLKTTRDCHSHRFGAQSYTLGYHIKLALYSQGYEVLTGIEPLVRIGAVESKGPHESAVYRLTHDVIMQGREELDMLVARITDCEKYDRWPAEYNAETDLLLPTWAMAETFEDVT